MIYESKMNLKNEKKKNKINLLSRDLSRSKDGCRFFCIFLTSRGHVLTLCQFFWWDLSGDFFSKKSWWQQNIWWIIKPGENINGHKNVFVPYLYKIILLLENDENKEKESYFSIENVENTKIVATHSQSSGMRPLLSRNVGTAEKWGEKKREEGFIFNSPLYFFARKLLCIL